MSAENEKFSREQYRLDTIQIHKAFESFASKYQKILCGVSVIRYANSHFYISFTTREDTIRELEAISAENTV